MADSKPPPPGKLLFLSREKAQQIQEDLERQQLEPDPNQFQRYTRQGKVFFRYRGEDGNPTGRGGGGRGRFELRVSDSKLYVAPGGVSHVEITQAEGEELPAVNVVPVIAELDGTPLDAATPPYFDLSAATDGAVWLIMQASPCESTGSAGAPPRVELTARSAEPMAAPGELAVLLAEFDLVDGSSGKAFDNMDVLHESDWIQHYLCSGSSSSSSSESGSGKDTAIVPMEFYESGYGAFFVVESKEVRFEDMFIDLKLRGAISRYVIDRRFIAACEPGTLRVVGAPAGDLPYAVGARIEGRYLVLRALSDPRRRPNLVNVKITAIRRGFRGVCLPPRSRAQFEANERRLNLENYTPS